ncbi:bifunctional DNA primase/polymerase [Paludisphaera sp.]|uniref:bifunctional DNA primase/polymerase n=1 Tax=Paludisphaera sp. TaxID=2017432 RepID=UPI00301CECB9
MPIEAKINKALEYAKLGFSPIRLHGAINGICTCGKMDCGSIGKHPNTPHGYKDATQDESVIRRWFAEAPLSNLGIAPQEGVVAVDVDPKNSGDRTWAEWQAEFGAVGRTPQSKTGSGGYHYLLTLPAGVRVKNAANKVGPGVDLRGHGGLIVVEPSVTDKGGYQWIVALTEPIAPCPDWLLDKIRESKGFHDDPTAKPQADPKGATAFVWGEDRACDFPSHPGTSSGEKPSRHDELCRLIGIHLNRGDSLKTIEAMATEWACRCTPPIPEKDVLKTVRGLANKESAKAGAESPSHGEEPQAPRGGAMGSEPEAGGLGSDPEPGAGDSGPAPDHLGVSSQEPESPESEETDDDDDWPRLDDDAFIGLAGQIVKAVEPETEADPAGILLTLLTAFGNAVGKSPSFRMSDAEHAANLFSALIGGTASGKGRAAKIVMRLMRAAWAEWAKEDVAWGLSSGEGLVDKIKDEGEEPEPKSLLCVETEFARTITAMRREGNTLSPLLRSAWDGQTLDVLTRGKSRIRATDPHVSLSVHATPEELAKLLKDSVETCNGFSNRILWTMVRRSKSLPEGGRHDVLDEFVEPLREAIVKAREIGACWRDDGAKALWREVYDELTEERPGAWGMAVSRGHAQTLRLSLIYALMDGTQIIGERHLRAALAVWRYCEDSARRLFGGVDTPGGQGQSLDIRLLDTIVKEPGISRRELRRRQSRKWLPHFDEAMASLRSRRLAHPRNSTTGGRPSETWHPGPGDDPDTDAESPFTFTWGDDDGEETPHPPAAKSQKPQPADLLAVLAAGSCDDSEAKSHGKDLLAVMAAGSCDDSEAKGHGKDLLAVMAAGSCDDSEAKRHGKDLLAVLAAGSCDDSESEGQSQGAPTPAPALLGVSNQEPYSIEDEAVSPEARARHLEAQREWREALAGKVKAQAHRLDRDDLARLSDHAYLDGLAKRLYLQAMRTRPDRRSSDPLPPDVEGDILWLERYVNAVAKEQARVKELKRQDISDQEWDDAFRSMLADAEAEEENLKIPAEGS